MSKKVLIRKQAGGVQQFQEIGGRRGPSFMGLARRLKDPTASGWQKVLAGAGMAGKVAAGIGAANQTLQQVHGGNAFAPLNLGYTYQGLDPTSGMERDATLGEQQDTMARNDVRDRSNQTLSNLHQQGYNVRDLASGARTYNPPPAGLPAETPVPAGHPYQQQWTDAGRTGTPPPTYDPFAAQRNAAIQRGPPGSPQPAVQQPPPVAQQPPPMAQPELHPLHPSFSPGGSRGPPVPAAPAAGASEAAGAPTNTAAASVLNKLGIQTPTFGNELVQATANTSVPTTAPATTAPATTAPATTAPATTQLSLRDYPSFAPNTGPNPPPLPSTPPPGYIPPVVIEPYQHAGFPNIPGTPGNVNPQPQNVNPQSQQDPTHGGRVDEANLTIDGVNYYTQAAFDAVKQREGLGLAKSFVQAIYDEMGDALYKADPHVAGLIISRIYMDKFVR
jgi:hypothetical protein